MREFKEDAVRPVLKTPQINLPSAETAGYPEKAGSRQPRGKTTGNAPVHSRPFHRILRSRKLSSLHISERACGVFSTDGCLTIPLVLISCK
jgi:hypothetical protein